MKEMCLSLLLLFGVSSVFSQCIFPPCHESDEEMPPEPLPPNDCCRQLSQELAEVRQNLSSLWVVVSETRDTAAQHLNHLHQLQMQIVSNQTGVPPADVYKEDQRRYHQSSSRRKSSRHHHHHSRGHRHYHHGCSSSNEQPGRPDYDARPPKAFARPPKVRNIEDFDFAICQMTPTSNVKGSTVQGVVYLSQKKNSDTLYIHVMMHGFKTPTPQPQRPAPEGHVHQDDEKFFLHGFHVHETADFTNGCDSTGPHFNPHQVAHGGPNSTVRHVGDFGNVASDSEGAINELITDEVASLRGEHSIIGKPFVVHALEDDLGAHSDDPGSTTTGNSGNRLACCVITELNPKPESTNNVRNLDFEDLEKQIVPEQILE